ncbi:MAG: hypothetical protein MUC88_02475 [Planctomycetes bacterium]|jgi:hypothetical protein|nr:hypothetical protein [Planctomycetota bacterium]
MDLDLTERKGAEAILRGLNQTMQGDEATRQIKKNLPQTRVIALSM